MDHVNSVLAGVQISLLIIDREFGGSCHSFRNSEGCLESIHNLGLEPGCSGGSWGVVANRWLFMLTLGKCTKKKPHRLPDLMEVLVELSLADGRTAETQNFTLTYKAKRDHQQDGKKVERIFGGQPDAGL